MYQPAFVLDLTSEPRAGSVGVPELLYANDRNVPHSSGVKDFVDSELLEGCDVDGSDSGAP